MASTHCAAVACREKILSQIEVSRVKGEENVKVCGYVFMWRMVARERQKTES